MSLFRRSRGALSAPPTEAQDRPQAGTLACTEAGCTVHTGVPCGYSDQRGRRCPTAWCPAHGVAVAAMAGSFCRRHAGVLKALAASSSVDLEHRPDVDDRSASLAEWVGNDLDQAMREILEAVNTGRPEVYLVVGPLNVYLYGVQTRVLTWERAWKLSCHTGTVRKICLRVEETHPDHVKVMVDSVVVHHTVPPWISARTRLAPLNAHEERLARGDYHETVITAVTRGLVALHRRDSSSMVITAADGGG